MRKLLVILLVASCAIPALAQGAPPQGGADKPQLLAVGNLSRWAFLLTFAGVGLRTSVRDLSKQVFVHS